MDINVRQKKIPIKILRKEMTKMFFTNIEYFTKTWGVEPIIKWI